MTTEYLQYNIATTCLQDKEFLEFLFKYASYIVLDNQRMIHKKHINGISNGHRGLAIYYKDGFYDWSYRLTAIFINEKRIKKFENDKNTKFNK